MRLIVDEDGEPLTEVTERVASWEAVRVGMQLGLVTADNLTWRDRHAVREFFARLPIVRPSKDWPWPVMVAEAHTVEGRDWCFATSRDGTFGVFSLDEPSRTFLEGATYHLWVLDPDSQHERRDDYTDLGAYQGDALEAMQAA